MYLIFSSRRYKRAYKRIKSRKNFNREKLEEVIDILACGKKLNLKYRDHGLKGEFSGFRECHVQNDLLLMY